RLAGFHCSMPRTRSKWPSASRRACMPTISCGSVDTPRGENVMILSGCEQTAEQLTSKWSLPICGSSSQLPRGTAAERCLYLILSKKEISAWSEQFRSLISPKETSSPHTQHGGFAKQLKEVSLTSPIRFESRS